MQSALDQFRISIGRVRDLIALHNSVKAQSTDTLDVSDMLRAALVLAVSALDYYVHEVVTLGMLEIHRGQRSEPNSSANTTQSAFSRFQVSLGIVDRRNKIAHEADIDPTFNIGSRWNIDELLVSDAVNFIEILVENIHSVL